MANRVMAAQSHQEQQNHSNAGKNNKHRPDLWGVWISIKQLYRLEFNQTMTMR